MQVTQTVTTKASGFVDDSDVVADTSVVQAALEVAMSMQTEILMFLLAVVLQRCVFGRLRLKSKIRNNIFSKGLLGGHESSEPCKPRCTQAVPLVVPSAASPLSCQNVPATKTQATSTRAVPQPIVLPSFLLRGGDRDALVEELRRRLAKNGKVAAFPSALADMMEALGSGGPKTPVCAAGLLCAIRDILAEHGMKPDGRLAELLLRELLGLQMLDAFAEVLAEFEAEATLPLQLSELALRAALKRGDSQETMKRLSGGICDSWRAKPASVPQCLLQQTARLASQSHIFPEVLPALKGLRLTCETLNVLLTESSKWADVDSFKAAVELGRAASVHFNTVTYRMLLANAASRPEMEEYLAEALARGNATRGILEKVAQLAAERADPVLADVVLQNLPSSPDELEQKHLGAISALLSVPYAKALKEGRVASDADAEVLSLYRNHFANVNLSVDAQAHKLVLDASGRGDGDYCKDPLAKLQAGGSLSASSSRTCRADKGAWRTTRDGLADEPSKKVDSIGLGLMLDDIRDAKEKPNSVTCSILLKSIQEGCTASEVERTMSHINKLDDEIDEVLLSSAVEACIRVDRVDFLGPLLQRHWASRRVNVRNAHTYGSIIRAYGIMRVMKGAWSTWREMKIRHVAPTSITLGCMMEAIVTNGDPEGGLDLLHELLQDAKTRPLVNAVVYCSVLKGFSHQKAFGRVWTVYKEMLTERVEFSVVTFNALFDACARCGEMSRVPELLDEMAHQRVQPNLITYSTIVKVYCQGNKLDKAFELLQTMKKTTRFAPDEIMYNSLLDGCSRKGMYDKGMEVLAEMEAAGVPPSNFTLSLLVKLAGRGRQLERAFELSEELPRRYKFRANVHVYGNLVQACITMKNSSRAVSVLVRMVRERVRPDVRTYALILRALIASNASDADLQDAEQLLRAAVGLQGAHPSLLAEASLQYLQPVEKAGLPAELISEVLEALVQQKDELAMRLSRDLQHLPGFTMDPRLKLRFANRAMRRN